MVARLDAGEVYDADRESQEDLSEKGGSEGKIGCAQSSPRQLLLSWEWIAREYGRMLYAFSYSLTRNPDDANDLVQDVFLKLHRSLLTYHPGSLKSWLYRIVLNAFYDFKRQEKRRCAQLFFDEVRCFPESEISPAPAEVLDALYFGEDVQQALDDLPDDFKIPVVLCDIVGLSYREIAEFLDIAIGTVRSRIHRGRLFLRRRLAHRCETVSSEPGN